MATRRRLLWLTDTLYSGYTHASLEYVQHLQRHMREHIDVFVLAVNHRIAPERMVPYTALLFGLPEGHTFSLDPWPWPDKDLGDLTPAEREEATRHLMGCTALPRVLAEVKPDAVLSINDNRMLERQLSTVREHCPTAQRWAFMAVDCGRFPRGFFQHVFDVSHHVLTMTTFGRREVRTAHPDRLMWVLPHLINPLRWPRVAATLKGLSMVDIDTDDRQRRHELRRRWFGDRVGPHDVVILNVNVGSVRKRLDLTLEAFAQVRRERPHARLALKTGRLDAGMQRLLDATAARHATDVPGLLNSICTIVDESLTDTDLATLYEAADVGVTSTSGEGWGLTPCEMAMVGRPVIVPWATSFEDIFQKPGAPAGTTQPPWPWTIPVRTEPFAVGRPDPQAALDPQQLPQQALGVARWVRAGATNPTPRPPPAAAIDRDRLAADRVSWDDDGSPAPAPDPDPAPTPGSDPNPNPNQEQPVPAVAWETQPVPIVMGPTVWTVWLDPDTEPGRADVHPFGAQGPVVNEVFPDAATWVAAWAQQTWTVPAEAQVVQVLITTGAPRLNLLRPQVPVLMNLAETRAQTPLYGPGPGTWHATWAGAHIWTPLVDMYHIDVYLPHVPSLVRALTTAVDEDATRLVWAQQAQECVMRFTPERQAAAQTRVWEALLRGCMSS